LRHACEDLVPERIFILYPGSDRYPLSPGIEAIGLDDLAGQLLREGVTGEGPAPAL